MKGQVTQETVALLSILTVDRVTGHLGHRTAGIIWHLALGACYSGSCFLERGVNDCSGHLPAQDEIRMNLGKGHGHLAIVRFLDQASIQQSAEIVVHTANVTPQ